MGNSLYLIAAILVLIWAIGFIWFSLGLLIHLLLVVAMILVFIRGFRGNKNTQ